MRIVKVALYASLVCLTLYSPMELTRVIFHWKAVFPEAAASLYFPLWVEVAIIWLGYIVAMAGVGAVIVILPLKPLSLPNGQGSP